MNLVELFLEQSRLRPQEVAMRGAHSCWTESVTFREFDLVSNSLAKQLQAAGLKRGDAVLLLVPITPELYVLLLGLMRLGAMAVVLDPSAGREHIRRCLDLVPPRALIGVAKAHLLRLISSATRKIPLSFSVGFPLPFTHDLHFSRAESPQILENVEPGHPALLTFTSGSTGQPKAVVRSHQFLFDQHAVLQKSIQLEPGEVDLVTLPIFGLANLASGVTSVIANGPLGTPGSIEPGPVLEQIETFRVSRMAASPAFVECLLKDPHASTRGKSLRKIFTGGAPVFPRLLRAMAAQWPQSQPTAVYGSTEAEPIAHVEWREMSSEDLDAMKKGKGLLAGHAVPEIEVAILENSWGKPIRPMTETDFRRRWCAVGIAGEIVVTGIHVLQGYLHGQGDEETKFLVEGRTWHRTGDMGRWDESGRLWLEGRASSWIEDERGELSPFAVECAALEQEEVARAGCLSVAGKRILAVEPFPGKIIAGDKLKSRLEWAHLDRVVVLDRLPVDKRHNAKIDYKQLARSFHEQR